ncbi:MAG TPA: acetyltransferase, partial [Gammaproteobacteria bacterium]|nr:acetyltransferase [Gammaproteobacteria bacterium]
MHHVLVVGAGGHGRAVAEVLRQSANCKVVGFLDDAEQGNVWEWPILGATTTRLESYLASADSAIVAIGNNRRREELQASLQNAGFNMITAVHPRAVVSATARIGSGCALMAGAIVGTEAVLEEGVIVNSGAVVDHHCRVEAFGHLGTNASMAGGSVLGRGAWMQAGASLGYQVC